MDGEGWKQSKSVATQADPKGQRWHYLAVKKLSALLRRITSKNDGEFYCFNYLHSFRTKNKPESHKNKDLSNVIMPSEDTKISELNQYQKCDKATFIIYVDM